MKSMLNTLIDGEETVKLSAVTLPIPVSVPLYLLAAFQVEAAPPVVFDGWLKAVMEAGDEALLAGVDRQLWNSAERWRILNELSESGVALPLYTRSEIMASLTSMEVQREQ